MNTGIKMAILMSAFFAVLNSAVAALPREYECPLDTPRAIFEKPNSAITKHTVNLINSHEIQETVLLTLGGLFRIKSWGCEYSVLTVRFELKHLFGGDKSVRSIYRSGAMALRILSSLHPNTIFKLPMSANVLENAAKEKVQPDFDTPLTVDAKSGIPITVTLIKGGTQGLADFVELELSQGPL